MTKTQIKKLHTILAKLEALQNETADPYVAARLGYGKSELLKALSMVDDRG